MCSMEVERLSELPKDRGRLLRLEKGFFKVFLPDYLPCFLCKVRVWEGLVIKPPIPESADGFFLHLLLFLKSIQPSVVKT